MSKLEVVWASDNPRPTWALDIPWKWVLPGQVCEHLGLPLGVRTSRPLLWKWAKAKLIKKLAKRTSNKLSIKGIIVVANFCITGVVNYYGLVAAPSIS